MVISTNLFELKHAQEAMEELQATKPSIFQKFMNIIQLTRQFQYGYQFMGSLIMDEDPIKYHPMSQDDYVLSVYLGEIEKLKKADQFAELKQLLRQYQNLSYFIISKLALGESPKALVGPTVVR